MSQPVPAPIVYPDPQPSGPAEINLEMRYRLLVETVQDYAIFMLDPAGFIISWNAGAEQMNGYTRDEIIGQHFSIFYPEDKKLAGWPQEELRRAAAAGRFEDEGWRQRKNGERFWSNVVITALRDEDGTLSGFAKITRDMSERKRLENLESSSQRVNEFLAMLGHELRNPLAPIRNAIGIMQLEPMLDPKLRQCRELIDRQLTHLTRLVDDLLDVGRINTGKIVLRRAPMDLREAMQHAFEVACANDAARQHQIELTLPDTPAWVYGDATRIVQAVQNLLHNAIKFTPPGGKIDVVLGEEARAYTVAVSDTGRGIDAPALQEVFNLFVQENVPANPSESGLGIGLTLARSLIEMHGGTIEAKSPGRGFGSTFTFWLPRLLEPLAGTGAGAAPVITAPAVPARAGYRVLVIDDNQDSADSMAMLLRVRGHDVKVAYGGESALALAPLHRPHLVLLDLALPGTDGFEVLEALKRGGMLDETIFAAMTGFSREEDIRRSQEVGFHAHLVKPVKIDALDEIFARIPASAAPCRPAAPPGAPL